MRDHQQQCKPGAQEQQRHRIKHGRRERDNRRRDRVGEEDLKQFHVGGDQRDHIAVATVRKRSRSESAQCVERTFTEQCEQTERQIVVHVLLAVGHDAADRRTHHHQGHGPADRQTPHRVTKRRARRHDAKHRHERGRQVAEHTKAACQHHQRTQ